MPNLNSLLQGCFAPNKEISLRSESNGSIKFIESNLLDAKLFIRRIKKKDRVIINKMNINFVNIDLILLI